MSGVLTQKQVFKAIQGLSVWIDITEAVRSGIRSGPPNELWSCLEHSRTLTDTQNSLRYCNLLAFPTQTRPDLVTLSITRTRFVLTKRATKRATTTNHACRGTADEAETL